MITSYPYYLVKKEALVTKTKSGLTITAGEEEPTGRIVGSPEKGLYKTGILVGFDTREAKEITLKGDQLILLKETQIFTTDL